ncbi:MAG: FixH family protein [Hyphomonas sp.]|nr:FixH family protein [Hyphomonas sp.]
MARSRLLRWLLRLHVRCKRHFPLDSGHDLPRRRRGEVIPYRRQHQQNEGWRAEIGVEGDTTSPLIRIRIVQRDGSALPVSAPTLQLRHPADRAKDRNLELKAVGQGEYVAEANAVAGIWTAIVVADVDPDTAGQEFKASREVSIK